MTGGIEMLLQIKGGSRPGTWLVNSASIKRQRYSRVDNDENTIKINNEERKPVCDAAITSDNNNINKEGNLGCDVATNKN